jgi:MoaA/NifB/PqqE/SkfB family radical SAM enzyme
MTLVDDRPITATPFLWLDLTRKCSLKCLHCYNGSHPHGDHGAMQREDWIAVLNQGAASGVRMIQLIGGEPTMHPNFPELVSHALDLGLKVEIFSNLVRIKIEWWELFTRPGVSLATSYYSDDAAEHNAITGRNSHRKTRANITRAIELKIPLRTGVIDVRDGQRIHEAQADLATLGVTSTGTDRLRHFGRGQGEHAACDVSELCGHCGDGRAAIGPSGEVSPCIMSTWLTAGNVREKPLAEILRSQDMATITAMIPPAAAGPCDPGAECRPDAYPPPPPSVVA